MRPTDKPTGAVWRLLREWSEEHPLHPNQQQMATFFEVSKSLLSGWKLRESVMQPDDMQRVSNLTGIPYSSLSEALREDMPFILEHHGLRKQASSGRRVRKTQDEQGEAPDEPGHELGA